MRPALPFLPKHTRSILEGAPTLDLLLLIGVIAVCATVQWRQSAVAINKAVLTEAFNLLRPHKIELVERLAANGTVEDAAREGMSADARGVAGRRIASVRDLEEAQAVVVRAGELSTEDLGAGRRTRRTGNLVTDLSDGVPTAAVMAPGMTRPQLIELRPALAPKEPAVVNWLCGSQTAPAGLKSPPPRQPAVSDELLPIVCRVKL